MSSSYFLYGSETCHYDNYTFVYSDADEGPKTTRYSFHLHRLYLPLHQETVELVHSNEPGADASIVERQRHTLPYGLDSGAHTMRRWQPECRFCSLG